MDTNEKVRIFLDRFNGRQDVYGKKWAIKDKEGKERIGYTPVCENVWKDFCHLRLKDGKNCSQCTHRKHEPVTATSVLRHINGEEEHLYYMLKEDGTVQFSAIDIDFKIGKEEMGYTWEDVKRISVLLDTWEIPHGLARSTGFGFHIYFFFEGRCKANLFRSLIFEIYARLGFIEQSRQGLKPIPELFPKQSYAGADGIGNGIKVPMIESRWEYERNGFIDKNGDFLSSDRQWEHLNNIPRIPQALVEKIIKEHEIPIIEASVSDSPTAPGRVIQGSFQRGPREKWQPPLTGSIEKLLEGCAAMRTLRDKCKSGKVLGHTEGMSLWHICMSTSDGVQWFYDNVPGWAKTDADRKQLQYSTAKNYSPHTCVALQQGGVCRKGAQCFTKKAPKDLVEGRYVVRTDLPKDQWPEPSPIRYAYGKGEDYLLKLTKESDDLKLEADPQLRTDKLVDLIYRIQEFDDKQLKTFKTHVKKLKLIPVSDLNDIFAEQGETREKQTAENLDARDDTVRVNEDVYQKWKPFGYGIVKTVRGKASVKQFCGCTITIDEQRVYQEDGEIVRSMYVGRCSANNISTQFEIENSKWYENAKFNEYFGSKLGEGYLVKKQDVDLVRLAAMKFSAKEGIERTSYIMTQGWYGDTYVMPSVVVDKEGIRPNTEQRVDLSGKQIANALDFKMLSDEDFMSTMMHIKSDLLTAWPKEWTSLALSQSFMAGLMKPLGIRKKPGLFFEGLTGTGKTEMMQTVAFFWGDFRRIANLSSTGLGIHEAAYNFKDALLVVDDYKGATRMEKQALERAIQYSYDEGSVRLKMKRDGSQADAKDSRALFMFTGEEFLSSDSAKVSRCILLEVNKYDISQTKEKYSRCIKERHNYAGVMPRFLHWFLNQNISAIKDEMVKIEDTLYSYSAGKTNAQRIAYNLSRSRIVFQLFCDFLCHTGVAAQEEKAEILKEHWESILRINEDMVRKCEEEQNGMVFARLLRQLLDSGEVAVKDLKEYDPERKTKIGFMKPNYSGVPTVYLFPDITYREVMRYGKESLSLSGSKLAIVRQLVEIGVIRRSDDINRNTKLVRVDGAQKRMWEMDIHKLGIALSGVSVVPEPNKFESMPVSDDGIF